MVVPAGIAARPDLYFLMLGEKVVTCSAIRGLPTWRDKSKSLHPDAYGLTADLRKRADALREKVRF